MFNKIKEIVDEQLFYDGELTQETRLREDLGADSIDVPVLVLALEDELGIRLSDEEIEQFVTIGDIIPILEKKVSAKEDL